MGRSLAGSPHGRRSGDQDGGGRRPAADTVLQDAGVTGGEPAWGALAAGGVRRLRAAPGRPRRADPLPLAGRLRPRRGHERCRAHSSRLASGRRLADHRLGARHQRRGPPVRSIADEGRLLRRGRAVSDAAGRLRGRGHRLSRPRNRGGAPVRQQAGPGLRSDLFDPGGAVGGEGAWRALGRGWAQPGRRGGLVGRGAAAAAPRPRLSRGGRRRARLQARCGADTDAAHPGRQLLYGLPGVGDLGAHAQLPAFGYADRRRARPLRRPDQQGMLLLRLRQLSGRHRAGDAETGLGREAGRDAFLLREPHRARTDRGSAAGHRRRGRSDRADRRGARRGSRGLQRGIALEFRAYPGLDHDPTMEKGTPDQLRWISDRFAGKPAGDDCGAN